MDEELLRKISRKIETPSYIFDFEELKKRVAYIKKTLGEKVSLCYAMKANPFLIESLEGQVDCFEVCSPGEFAICEMAHIPMPKIVLSGVYKEHDEINRVIEQYDGQGVYTVESLHQLELLEECSKKQKKRISILLRLSNGNQFGMDEKTITYIIQNKEQYQYMEIRGIQYYSGTQKKSHVMVQELEYLDRFCIQLQKDFDFEVQELEYGPGAFVYYFEAYDHGMDNQMFFDLRVSLADMQFGGHVTLEMGRFIAATCGYYISKIVDLKSSNGNGYCMIDGGINHLNYYGQMMGMKQPSMLHIKMSDSELNLQKEAIQKENLEKWNVCGALCTSSDVIVKQKMLDSPQIGDLLIFKQVGAYSITEGIYLFLSRDLPTVYGFSERLGVTKLRHAMCTYEINYKES